MTVTIRIKGHDATIDGGDWSTDSTVMAAMLPLFDDVVDDELPGPSEPDLDYWIAQQVIAVFGGKITDHQPAPDDDTIPEGAVH